MASLLFSPGRANLIGEHTDYAGGYVMPFALPLGNFFLSRRSRSFEIFSHLYGRDSFDLNSLKRTGTWRDYFRGAIWSLAQEHSLEGISLEVFGNLPPEAGLSSSASVEVGTILSVSSELSIRLRPIEVVKLAKKAENDFVGVPCGIMDQFSIVFSKEGNVTFLDCETLKYDYLKFPDDLLFLIFFSGKSRSLSSSPYSKIRKRILGALRRVRKSAKELSKGDLSELSGGERRAAEYLIRENERVLRVRDSLKSGDVESLELLFSSHEDAKELLGISSPELDFFVNVCKSLGAYGARLTGAGFGGSGIAVFDDHSAFMAVNSLKDLFFKKFEFFPKIWICSPSKGAQQFSTKINSKKGKKDQ